MAENEFTPFNARDTAFLSEEYLTKRMSLLLKNGDIITGVVGWLSEYDFEEDTGIECDWGFVLNEAVLNGRTLGYDLTIPESRIEGYCPLEPPNTEEELKQLFSEN